MTKSQFLYILSLKTYTINNLVKEFNDYRTRMNDVILRNDNLVIKRLWNLDTNTYAEGDLDVKTKELLGLVVRQPADVTM
ncbi:MAG: hypothetical protein WAT34_03960 [Chitinophagaceae bacterium]